MMLKSEKNWDYQVMMFQFRLDKQTMITVILELETTLGLSVKAINLLSTIWQ